MIQNTYKQMGDNDVIKRNLWNMPCVFVLDEDESHYFHSWETTECTMDGGCDARDYFHHNRNVSSGLRWTLMTA